jgi:predicted phosphoribosyltransferase
MRFRDRRDAGRLLAERLAAETWHDPVILALPRGGVPVAFEIATALHAPLDVLVVRKVGAPHHREFGIGAIAEGGVTIRDDSAARMVGVSLDRFDRLAAEERRELERRVQLYRGDRSLPQLDGRDVVLVDDGLATGATMRAAVRAVRTAEPARVIVAVPVGPPDTCADLAALADDLVCPLQPPSFSAVGQWYVDFGATTDDDVLRLLGTT